MTTMTPADEFFMPTLAGDALRFVPPTEASFDGAPRFHEDEWAQLEFYDASRLEEIQQRMREYSVFEQSHRGDVGWTGVYTRDIPRTPIVSGPDVVARIASVVSGVVRPAPLLTTTTHPLGQVENGFTIVLGENLGLYGLMEGDDVTVLAAIVGVDGDNAMLARAFFSLNRADNLILADWEAQRILVSADEKARFQIWEP